jgi:hypothetical protein
LVRKPDGRDHLEDLGPDGKVFGLDFRAVGLEVVDWIHLALGTGMWWVHLNMVMNVWVQ